MNAETEPPSVPAEDSVMEAMGPINAVKMKIDTTAVKAPAIAP
jgi:hypothetical protein